MRQKNNNSSKQIIGLSYTLLLLTMNENNQFGVNPSKANSQTANELEKKIKAEKRHVHDQVKLTQQKTSHYKVRPKEAPIPQANSYCFRKR